jgi:hypothetical protein
MILELNRFCSELEDASPVCVLVAVPVTVAVVTPKIPPTEPPTVPIQLEDILLADVSLISLSNAAVRRGFMTLILAFS